jgi:hypothetical protein
MRGVRVKVQVVRQSLGGRLIFHFPFSICHLLFIGGSSSTMKNERWKLINGKFAEQSNTEISMHLLKSNSARD